MHGQQNIKKIQLISSHSNNLPTHRALLSSRRKPSLHEHMKLPNVLVQWPFWHKFSYSSHSLISSRSTCKYMEESTVKAAISKTFATESYWIS